MDFETSCPVCRQPVTIWTVMASSTPSRIKCKNCKAHLSIKKEDWLIVIIAFVVAGIPGFLLGFYLTIMYLSGEMEGSTAILIIAAIMIPLILIVDLLMDAHICTKGLIVAKKPR